MQNRSQTFDVAPITIRHFLRRRARVKKTALQIRFFSVLLADNRVSAEGVVKCSHRCPYRKSNPDVLMV